MFLKLQNYSATKLTKLKSAKVRMLWRLHDWLPCRNLDCNLIGSASLLLFRHPFMEFCCATERYKLWTLS